MDNQNNSNPPTNPPNPTWTPPQSASFPDLNGLSTSSQPNNSPSQLTSFPSEPASTPPSAPNWPATPQTMPNPEPAPTFIQPQTQPSTFNTGTNFTPNWPSDSTPASSAPFTPSAVSPLTEPVSSSQASFPEPLPVNNQESQSSNQSSAWTPPQYQAPSVPEPTSPVTNLEPAFTPDTNSAPPTPSWPPISSTMPSGPATFTPPQPDLTSLNIETPAPASNPVATPQPNLSPLDNPWGSAVQPPVIDGVKPQSQSPIQPSWMNIEQTSTSNANAPTPPDSAPTDLSHLISNNTSQPQSAQATPDTFVAPSASPAPEVPNIPTENHKSIPLWLIGIGISLLVLVIGTSAYFILGIGQPTKTTTSLPAVIANTPSVATPIPQPSTQTAATSSAESQGSASFGQLQGGDNQSATSASELLRQRQQGE